MLANYLNLLCSSKVGMSCTSDVRELQYDHPLVYGFYVTVDDICIGDFYDSLDIAVLF
jgi:hypothetical protein